MLTTQHPCEHFCGTSLLVLVGDSDVLFDGDLVDVERVVSEQLDWKKVQRGLRCLRQSLQSDLTVEMLSWAS